MNVGGRDSTEYPLQKTNKHPVYLVKVVVSFGMGLSRVLMDDFISNFIRNSRFEKKIFWGQFKVPGLLRLILILHDN